MGLLIPSFTDNLAKGEFWNSKLLNARGSTRWEDKVAVFNEDCTIFNEGALFSWFKSKGWDWANPKLFKKDCWREWTLRLGDWLDRMNGREPAPCSYNDWIKFTGLPLLIHEKSEIPPGLINEFRIERASKTGLSLVVNEGLEVPFPTIRFFYSYIFEPSISTFWEPRNWHRHLDHPN